MQEKLEESPAPVTTAPTKQIQSHKFELETSQRQAFLQIFNMYAKNGKINRADLEDIFERIGYYVSESHLNELCDKIFEIKEEVTFEQFMDVFKVKNSQYSLRDIRNAFRLIAGDSDKYIPLMKIVDLFKKQDIDQERVEDLLIVLDKYIDSEKSTFDYQLFLSHLH